MRNNHTDFILSPISNILEDTIAATNAIGCGIETYPLYDYVMQSTFLKMTGFQEQKLKCICWELASYDYEYRYNFLNTDLGECSSYKDKNSVYKHLFRQIKKLSPAFVGFDDPKRTAILNETTQIIERVFLNSNLFEWMRPKHATYKDMWQNVKISNFTKPSIPKQESTLFADGGSTSLSDIFTDHIYKYRNRCAHNTLSYQQNLPTLKALESGDYNYDNYFLWFATLVLIDTIFVELFKIYNELISNAIYV